MRGVPIGIESALRYMARNNSTDTTGCFGAPSSGQRMSPKGRYRKSAW